MCVDERLFRVNGVEHMLSDDMLRAVDWYRRNHSVCSVVDVSSQLPRSHNSH